MTTNTAGCPYGSESFFGKDTSRNAVSCYEETMNAERGMMNAEQTETEKRDRAGRGGLCLITLSHAPFIIHRSSFRAWGFKPSYARFS
jgi:hypothetical protein